MDALMIDYMDGDNRVFVGRVEGESGLSGTTFKMINGTDWLGLVTGVGQVEWVCQVKYSLPTWRPLPIKMATDFLPAESETLILALCNKELERI